MISGIESSYIFLVHVSSVKESHKIIVIIFRYLIVIISRYKIILAQNILYLLRTLILNNNVDSYHYKNPDFN